MVRMPAASEDSVSPPVILACTDKNVCARYGRHPTLSLDGSPQAPVDVPPALVRGAIFACSIGSDMAGSARSTVRWDPRLEREVALKLLLPNSVGGDEEYRALLREARGAGFRAAPQHRARLRASTGTMGEVGSGRISCTAKRWSALIPGAGAVWLSRAALIGLDVSRALSAVHRTGLLHRDINPKT